ncbi:GNAT family N-acetyltransferase [Microbacteriaceae bacterium 4G12]
MKIRVLQASDARCYQELRLTALQVNSEAFGSTYEREVKFSLETIIERIQPTENKFVLGAFNDQNQLVGIVAFVRESGLKDAHKANIYGMFVAPEMRGSGLGKALMLELIRKAKNLNGLEQLKLTVMSENGAAKQLYKSIGFEVYGVEQNALKLNGQYFDEDLMVLMF